jgi:hypothetical protein
VRHPGLRAAGPPELVAEGKQVRKAASSGGSDIASGTKGVTPIKARIWRPGQP